MGPLAAGLWLWVSLSPLPLLLEMKGRILCRRWEGKPRENPNPGPAQSSTHEYLQKADTEMGLGPQCQEALASPWGKNTISNHQASGGGGRHECGLHLPLGCLLRLPTLPGTQENKGFPFSLHQRKSSCPTHQGQVEDGSWARGPKGTRALHGGHRRKAEVPCSGIF